MNHAGSRKPTDNKRPVIFLAVGIFNTLVDFLFYTFLTQIVLTKPSQIGLAGVISGTFALLCAFATHNYITWRERPADRQTVIRFFAFTGFGMWVLRPILLSIFIKLDGLYSWAQTIAEKLHLPLSDDFIVNTGAFCIMVFIVLIYNFLAYDRLVFKDEEKDQ